MKTRRNQKAENLGLICHCLRMETVGGDGSGEKKVRLQPGLFSETLEKTHRQTDTGGRVGGLPVQRFFNIGLALNIITNQSKSYRFPLPAHTCSLPSIFSPQETKGVYLKAKRT